MTYILLILGIVLVIWGIIGILRFLYNKGYSFIKGQFLKKKADANKENCENAKTIEIKNPVNAPAEFRMIDEMDKRKELLNIVDSKLPLYEQIVQAYYKWYNQTIESLGMSTPTTLNDEVSFLAKRMKKNCDNLDEMLNQLTACKNKSNSEIEKAIQLAEETCDKNTEEVELMLKLLTNLSLRWENLSDEEKRDKGILRKI
jgi:hypothetical protein